MNKADDFQEKIWKFYTEHKRMFPWRETTDPYAILVSEVMLQQTQTSRVVEKYREFLETFPTVEKLANSSNQTLLRIWQGLGYNRRALWLKQATQIIVERHSGVVPNSLEELVALPGIGKNTAGAILAFAYNIPVIFIETNIRRVFIHEFFADREGIDDKEIFPLIKQTIDKKRPREFYYALMDYGAALPKITTNPNRKSKHYTKQSTFEGSLRQTRGKILKTLLNGPLTEDELLKKLASEHTRKALTHLLNEGFVEKKGKRLTIPS